MIDREQIFKLLKHLIIQIRDNGENIQKDNNLKADWQSKFELVNEGIKSLNSCDADWLNTEYGKWFQKEIVTHPKYQETYEKIRAYQLG